MFGLAKGSRTDSRRTTRSVAVAKSNTPDRAAGQPSTCLMSAEYGLAIPRLDGVPGEHQLWQGEEAAARLAHSFLEAGIADADDWTAANRNPFEFLKRALERWLREHHGIDEYIDAVRRIAAERGKLIKSDAAEGFVQHLGHAYPQNDLLKEMFA